MFERIFEMLAAQHIFLCGVLPLADCTIRKQYLLDRVGIEKSGSVILFAIPYHTPSCEQPDRNISRYAVSRDYHLFVKQLSDLLLPQLHEAFPGTRFAMFCDHSPIDERQAAARIGIGCIGQNGLLITELYSSYVFLGEIITDAPCEEKGLASSPSCQNCGACLSVCPLRRGETDQCLSALTQKKGNLTENECQAIRESGSVWGCDLCQEVCPHTAEAKRRGTLHSPIPFFYDTPIPHLTYQAIEAISDAEFSARAYAWRGKDVILRNLAVRERKHEDTEKKKN